MEVEKILKISDLARGGAGLAKDEEGRVVFIPWTVPGDLVRCKIVEAAKNYAHAELVEIIEASPQRIVARCPVFGTCGGCQWQHIPYSIQWDTKVNGVLRALSRMKLVSAHPAELFPAEEIWNYRNRIQLRGEGSMLGYLKSGSHELVPTDRCDIARSEINKVWDVVRAEAANFNRPVKVEMEVLPDGSVRKSWNSPHSAAGFRQVHDSQNLKLIHWVASVLPDQEILYDLFGGSGNLSLPLAEKAGEVHCVDLSVPLQQTAKHFSHFHFHRSPVETWVTRRALEKQRLKPMRASAILDPPRAGLGKHFDAIASSLEKLGVQKGVAVGCDPDSWLRDLSKWLNRGWKLERVALFDLFPQTYHLESVALIVRT